jgi:glyceraldehyde 3-phosphate dehydrogenase
MKIRVAINGFGRIGRAFFRVANKHSDIDIVAINDLGDPKNLAYLLKYDSAHGVLPYDVKAKSEGEKHSLLIDNKKDIPLLCQKDPCALPWKEHEVDIVVEASGAFASYEKSKAHLEAGAKRVVITAPVKDEPEGINGATVLMGLNDDALESCDISSNASCTTNAGSPLISILNEKFGIEKALLNTVHGYTASQSLVDGATRGGDFRRGRAAAQNIIPSSTGAATALTKVVKELEGKFDGIALRVPVITGSIVDLTYVSRKDITANEVNDVLKEAAKESRWEKIFSVTEEQIVSSDIVGSTYASIADLSFTRVAGGNLVKVLAWYDNEMGYVHALVEHVIKSSSYLNK